MEAALLLFGLDASVEGAVVCVDEGRMFITVALWPLLLLLDFRLCHEKLRAFANLLGGFCVGAGGAGGMGMAMS